MAYTSTSPDITERLPGQLSGGIGSGGTSTWKNTNFKYDFAVGGLPFRSAASDRLPYERATQPIRKEQFDPSANPGEQSLTGWWLRSQNDFRSGAGIRFLEPANDERIMRRFRDSVGVNPWVPGQISLHPATALVTGTAPDVAGSPVKVLGFRDSTGTDGALIGSGTKVWRYTTGTPTAVTWGGTTAVQSMTDNGATAYVASSDGIYSVSVEAGSTGTKLWNSGPTVKVAWLKGRLMAGINNSIYELAGGTPPTLPSPTYTHPNTSWTWTALAEGPVAIYAAGYSGSRSVIYKFLPDETLSGGAFPVLGKGASAAELPPGEIVYAITTYLGYYIAIATNLGVRIGLIDANGDITYGPISLENYPQTYYPVKSLYAADRFVYAGTTNAINGLSGLWRYDLSDNDNNNPYILRPARHANASDLQAKVTGDVTGIAQVGSSRLLIFGVAGQGAFGQATSLEPSGWLRTAQTRYNTVEPKSFQKVRFRVLPPTAGQLNVATVDRTDNVISLITVDASSNFDTEVSVTPSQPQESLGLKFTLTRSSTDTTTGPVLLMWQFKAQPAATPQEIIKIPVLLMDYEKDTYQVQDGAPGYAYARFRALKDMEAQRLPVRFQDLTTGEQQTVVVEEVDFRMTGPPTPSREAFGGLATITMRTLV